MQKDWESSSILYCPICSGLENIEQLELSGEFIKNFEEIIIDQICIKSCKCCGKQVPHCFCDELCNKVTEGSMNYEYEYLTCNNENCEFLRVRCTKCKHLCNIESDNSNGDLFWCCDKECEGNYYKQGLLETIRRHVNNNQRNILNINGELFCRHDYYYVDNLRFKSLFIKSISNGRLKETDINHVKSFLNEKNPILANSIENDYISYSQLNIMNSDNSSLNTDRKAFELIKKLAEEDYVDAQYKLRHYYEKGIDIDVVIQLSYNRYFKSVKIYNNAKYKLNSVYRLSDEIILDEIVNKNKKQVAKVNNLLFLIVISILCLSCFIVNYGVVENIGGNFVDNEYGRALYNLAQYFSKIDAYKAFKYYKNLAEVGYDDAQFKLGMCYQFGTGTMINKVKAFKLYEAVAEKGHIIAQYELSSLYELGEGVDKDEEKAFELIKELADRGYTNAQCRLGNYYEKGIGTDVNITKACDLYQTAADKGNIEVLKSLYDLLSKRRCYLR